MIEINRHIEILLLSNDCVIVPGFGGFMAHHVDARYDGRDNMFLPPLRTVGFNPQLTMNDSLLALSYVETYDISYPEALRRIEDEVVEIRQSLENEGKFEIENIGMLFLNEDGNISFEPCEAGILTPDFYGLGGFDMLPIAQIDNSEQQNENPNVAMTVNLAKDEQPVKNEAEAPAAPANNSVFIAEEEEEEELPPAMPEKLPSLIKLLVSRTPDIYKPAVAHAVFPSLATHLYQVSFEYVDGVEHEATLMNVLMAPTGAGKSCVNAPINHIMADIRKRDEVNLQREKEWKLEVNTMGTHKYKPKRPTDLMVQEVDPDMTSAAFVQRMYDAKGHFLYSNMNEIDQWDAIEDGGKGKQRGRKWTIMCLAFDPGNSFGQTRAMPGSVNERVHILYNWNACTTIGHGRQFFKKVVSDGPLSRINFCTIPPREIGSDMPVYGDYDEAFDEELRPYINRLCKVRGKIDCPQAVRLINELMEECRDFSICSQDRIYENFSFRALVIAYLKACVLYVANGCKWEDEIDDFIRWSLHYDLWCKMRFFWDLIDDERHQRFTSRGPQNLLQQLPDDFTWEALEKLRDEANLKPGGTREMLKSWMKRGYLEYDVVSRKTLFRKSAFGKA